MASWRPVRVATLALTLFCAVAAGSFAPALAQVTPAAGSTPADDTPSVKVGGVIYADYTYQDSPRGGTEPNTYHPSSFNVTRGYINVTGNISHLFSFRVTPDVKQETNAVGADGKPSSLNGNSVFRLKYAFGQFNMDDWLPKGSWVRLGMQQTPYVDFVEGIYRYRFQGKIMPDREKFLSSADAGLSAKFAFPGNYGEVHLGYYNGENYESPEINDQKATEIRASVRPAPMTPVLKGLRVHGFLVSDKPVSGGKRDRLIGLLTFEHERVNVGYEYMDAKDKKTSADPQYDSKGWSAWATPKLGKGFEALLRYDDVQLPANGPDARNKRTIVGVAYWPPVQKGVTMAVMLDYDGTKYEDYTTPKTEDKKYILHTQFTW